MGRKSSAKKEIRPSGSGSEPPPTTARGFSPLLIGAVLVVVAIAGTVLVRNAQPPADSGQPAAAQQTPVDPPEAAKLGPHPQENLPPLPYDPAPARPMDTVRAAYKFAAEHPEVLSYVPCYCGCERSGHRGNEDCFVTRRDAKGDVVEWEPHGMT